MDAAVAKISELKAFVIDNTTIGVGTYKEDYSGLTEGAKGRIMVSVQWPFRLADGFNTEEGLTSIEEYLYNDERGELVRNVAVLDKMNPSTTGNWPCNLSGSFDLGVQRISSSGSWNNGLYELTGDEVTQADLPDKVVVEFTYKGVLFVIEEEVELTPEMFIAEPSPEDFGYTFDAATKTITGYNGDEAALVIPSSFKVDGVNVPVEIIKEYAFSNNTTLTSVEMPDTLKTIYRNAFAGCTNLESVHLGNNVSTISTYAFDGCTSLKSIAIPNSVTSLGTYAFRGCSNLETITIGSGLTTITNNVFEGCSKLNNVTIPSNITLLGKDTFKDCVGLTDLTIEGNVRGTNGGAFSGCSNLTTVTIGNSVTSIGNYLFQNHSALTSIIIPVGVTEFGQFAFSGTGLTSIEIPSSVTTLGNYVFQNCNKLGSIAIPDTVTSLGTYAFAGCTELSDITIGSGLTTIKDNTFARCPSLVSMVIPDNITSIGYSAFIGTYESGAFTGENLDKIIIGADVMIAGDVFGTAPRNTFEETYAANGKAAGTYVFDGEKWTKQSLQ
ncbi:MAG: leucine-rich repeat domain-containing protein [Desulfitobacteriia bacterium]